MPYTYQLEAEAGAYDPRTDGYVYRGPGLRLMINNCTAPQNRWVGLRVPDVPGTLASLSLSDGSTVYEAVKGLSGIGARSGGGLLHFGLGPDLLPVSAAVYDVTGALVGSLSTLEVGAYNPVTTEL